MLSKILKLENVEVLNKNEQRHIIGGYHNDPDNPCEDYPRECSGTALNAFCAPSSSANWCNPCVFCVN